MRLLGWEATLCQRCFGAGHVQQDRRETSDQRCDLLVIASDLVVRVDHPPSVADKTASALATDRPRGSSVRCQAAPSPMCQPGRRSRQDAYKGHNPGTG